MILFGFCSYFLKNPQNRPYEPNTHILFYLKPKNTYAWQYLKNSWFKSMAIHSFKTQFLLTTLKPNSYWQYQNPIPISNIKTQFSLATSKPNSYWQHQSPILIDNTRAQFSLIISKLNSYWQHQNPILIGNIKTQFLLAILYQREKSLRLSMLGKEKISW